MKFLILIVILIAAALVDTLADKAIGIDWSSLSAPKRIAHSFIYKLTGLAIALYALSL